VPEGTRLGAGARKGMGRIPSNNNKLSQKLRLGLLAVKLAITVITFRTSSRGMSSSPKKPLNEKKEGCEGVGGETGKKRSNKKEKEPDNYE
jgi:hypothetical protein